MASVGNLTVDLIAQTASFNANISKAAANLNTNTARMNRSIAGLQSQFERARKGAELLAGAFALREIAGAVKNSLEFAGSLGETAQQLGVTSKQLQVYRYIGGQVGIQQEEMDKGLAKLSVSLGKGALGAQAQADAFAALGISLRAANGHVKTAGDVLPEIAARLGKIADPAQRAAAEVALFGKAGQKLDTILAGGQGNIDDYAKRAQELGLVLDDHLINQADAAADKMAELSTQMKVNFASAVAQNATSILALASALSQLTFQSINFIAQHPRLVGALAGAAMGARVAGLPGAAIGALGGTAIGGHIAQETDDANMDLRFRAGELRKSLTRLKQLRANGPVTPFNRGTFDAAVKEVKRQTELGQKASAAQKGEPPSPALPVVDLPNFLAPSGGGSKHGPKGPSAKELAEQAARREKDFQDKLADLNSDYLNAKQDNLTSASDIATNARQQLMAERTGLIIDTEAKVKAGDLTRAQGDLIEQKAAQVAAEKLITINTEEAARMAQDSLNIGLAANDNQRDLLQAQNALAVTAKDRRDIALKLLDLDQQEEKTKLEAVLASKTATDAEKKIAAARMASLPAIYGARGQDVKRQTAGPLESYLQSIPNGSDQIGERVQQLEIAELESVRQGIDNAISNVLGTKDPLLIGLIDLFIQENLIKPIAAALQAHSGNSGGGFFGKLLGLGSKVFAGGISAGTIAGLAPDVGATIAANPGLFANGTTGAPGGWAFVGEAGPELLHLPTGAQVIPNHRLPSLSMPVARNDNRAANLTINNHFPGVTNAREAREAAGQVAHRLRKQLNGPIS